MMNADSDSLVDVVLNGSTERLCPDGAASEQENLKAGVESSGRSERSERRSQCCWVVVLVPSCSLVLAAALATLTVGALMATSCSMQAQYAVSCQVLREAIINSSSRDLLLPSSSFQVLTSDAAHITVRHESPVNGAQLHVYFLLKDVASANQPSCTCLSMAASSVWFHLDDAGAGFCALQHLSTLGTLGIPVRKTSATSPTSAMSTTCSPRALTRCQRHAFSDDVILDEHVRSRF